MSMNRYYLDNLYSPNELEDFNAVWDDFVLSYGSVIDDNYKEIIANA